MNGCAVDGCTLSVAHQHVTVGTETALLAVVGATRLQAKIEVAQARIVVLEEALRKCGQCPRCHGKGTTYQACTLCGDSTYDHYCNGGHVPCGYCKETGVQPEARAALAETEAPPTPTPTPNPCCGCICN